MSVNVAINLFRSKIANSISLLNRFSISTFQTRGGRLGSGMGTLLEACLCHFMNQSLSKCNVPNKIEIAWLEDHESNDFACILRDSLWSPRTRNGELFKIECKSMNKLVDESKGHFAELRGNMGFYDQIIIIIWQWEKMDTLRVYPKIIDYFVCSSKKLAFLRDALHIARGGYFICKNFCPDQCGLICKHIGEPLNSRGKREKISGPENARPSLKQPFANNFGGLVRMLKTNNDIARKVFRWFRKNCSTSHNYITFIHRNFPNEEINQYLSKEWKKIASIMRLEHSNKDSKQIFSELQEFPKYRDILRDRFNPQTLDW